MSTSGLDEFTSFASVDLTAFLDDGVLVTDRARTAHAVASVLVTVPGRVLLARNGRGWGTVGGHVEATDGSLRAAAAREALEEVGLALDSRLLRPLSVVVDAVASECRHADFCFSLDLPSVVEPTAGSDVLEARWFPLDDLPEVNAHMRHHLNALA